MTNVWQMPETQRVRSTAQPWITLAGSPPAFAGRDATYEECEWGLAAGATPPLGAHVVTSRIGYTHHGIHVGAGRVVHYSGLSRGWRGGPVEEVSLAEFARGRPIRVRVHAGARFERDAVVARARSRLGESSYKALTNNCEHLCEWCIYGEHRSRQVEQLRSRPRRWVEAMRRLVGAPLRVLLLPGLSVRRRIVPGDYAL